MYKTIIGLEIHAQLLTKTKAFCSCSAENFEFEPNTNICPICTGQPGTLPVLNEEVVKLAIKAGLILNGSVNKYSRFDRKNYFYPDLPKNYQITQYFHPIVTNGYIKIGDKKVRIRRAHLEEDTAKMLHEGDQISTAQESLIDFNRSGIPLLEIVTEPDIETPFQTRQFMEKLRDLLRYAEISTGDMEKGALRCDANISILDENTGKISKRVEIKNINSFKFVEKALEYEKERLIKSLETEEELIQETRGWDSVKKETFSMRTKEEEMDYRYFPEPDLLPLILTDEFIDTVKKTIPEMPDEKMKRFVTQYNIPEYDAGILSSSKELADYFEKCVEKVKDAKFVSNLIMTDLLRAMKENEDNIENVKIKPEFFSDFKELLDSGKISTKIMKEIFPEVYKTGKSPKEIIKEKGLEQIDDEAELRNIVEQVIRENPDSVEKYKSGKTKLLGFFVGEVMKRTKGKANPQKTNQILKEFLD
ncbi:Asp-tRNA(Asn)/Glu-tRNA(Gln) amidotransferase subunit GatB [Petrotoga sp. 9PWA.NaAc.5.4]|uniref:Asp-tRNA(Asn)/Glu-tRNA(Gln) amidotransferase subunit GatB n=1 Tax=Petrotoga sp. 9PWA.NaAc.5.4 TaxID=1434328 RepID=UPI000CC8ED0D|nr:Asp-tRNA(Asn)/Glu-tRNA(Gln) amidotransferase subunit GatB [Petrotoga sp. 9PWA.NaAc.5.4]PNR96970.1 aspartyl/glutamyl-tRNA amidotransferase subunit B [Petrotoga sp. 9PWA.NaAc.5.4]